ncbi:DUF6397 family protein [Streptomyces sp. 6N223]|uniref:DUF6397 family protein n=1 Tax=Streptomyces sp. 6N223 TaxID=3457412 RepID=UPI003FD2A76F
MVMSPVLESFPRPAALVAGGRDAGRRDAEGGTDASVSERHAAAALALGRRELEIAVRLGHIATVASGVPWERRVPRAEIERLASAPGFPGALRDRIRLVNASEGAALLRISPARFSRLARGGCLAPLSFHPHHRAIVWRYPAEELRLFALRHPELLSGPAPGGLLRELRGGADWRPRRWRARHTGLLAQQAGNAWERAAVAAAVLDPAVVTDTVPDPVARARLHRLRPPLGDHREDAAVRAVLRVTDPDESRWYAGMLREALREARALARPRAPVTADRRR